MLLIVINLSQTLLRGSVSIQREKENVSKRDGIHKLYARRAFCSTECFGRIKWLPADAFYRLFFLQTAFTANFAVNRPADAFLKATVACLHSEVGSRYFWVILAAATAFVACRRCSSKIGSGDLLHHNWTRYLASEFSWALAEHRYTMLITRY